MQAFYFNKLNIYCDVLNNLLKYKNESTEYANRSMDSRINDKINKSFYSEIISLVINENHLDVNFVYIF